MGGDYDPDTTGDFDETTLDGSEGLDGDIITSDGENYVMDAPDRWRGADPHDSLDSRLAEEKPDVDLNEEPEYDPEQRYHDDSDYDDDYRYPAHRPADPDHNRRLGFSAT
ncbi:hypothetical protein KRX51_07195 [Corynebacterium sp. TAE3-ERU12]|uniref:hypothetical protein n=1 Tax=Corynebacterium sp. TAE3-ERU12 TaxID=2849491 RepID=UPI001C4448FC|nr:hypothetical protein [Corynebacterium sp. TAE3-ERU12]MBV7295698.1 hypothetical protein [Corynebacterium sp. TAE3-ERU12]